MIKSFVIIFKDGEDLSSSLFYLGGSLSYFFLRANCKPPNPEMMAI